MIFFSKKVAYRGISFPPGKCNISLVECASEEGAPAKVTHGQLQVFTPKTLARELHGRQY